MTWSIRRRLGVAATAAAALLVVIIGLAGLTENWRRTNVERKQDLEFAADAYDTAVSEQSFDVTTISGGSDEFVALFDADAQLIEASPNVPSAALQDMADNEIDLTSLGEEDVLITQLEDGSTEWEIAVMLCSDGDVCDSIVTGNRPVTWSSFVGRRLGWLLGALLGVSAIVWFGARWLVGRSLRDVERMRRELDTITATTNEQRIDVPPTGDELAALATSMNATVDRLGAALSAQRQFVSDSAHELRSPLAGLRATLELAQQDPHRSVTAIPEAIAQVDRTSALIEGLLQLARRDAGVGSPRRLADIDDIVRMQVRELARRLPNLVIQARHVAPVQQVVDAGGIERMLRKLLDNAGAHCATTVAVELAVGDGLWRLTVDDDGPGIPEADRHAVFERFRRLDESRSRDSGGTGLGLAIVAGIVADHDGTVRVEQAPLGGARVIVEIPLTR